MSSYHWLYLRIGAPGVQAAESLLRHVIAPFMSERGYLENDSRTRWFFIRYLDSTGLHVRIRICGQQHVLQEIESALRSTIGNWCAQGHGQINYICRAMYFPEFAKWGGIGGVRRAEKVFAASSRFALAMPATYWDRRYGLALLLMYRGVGMLPSDERLSFIYNYAWYWYGGSDPSAPRIRDAVRKGAQRAASHLEKQMTAWESAEGRWQELMEAYIKELGEDLLRASHPSHRLFNHAHLTSNRLGVSPRDEALLAEVVRLKLL